MSRPLTSSLLVLLALCGLAVCVLSGCGGGDAPPAPATAGPATAPSTPDGPAPTAVASLPTASLTSDAAEAGDEPAVPAPEPGTVEFLIREITEIRAIPYGFERQPSLEQPGQQALVKLTTEEGMQSAFQRHLHAIIDKATEAISRTHDAPDKTQIFNNAVHYLADARMQLALAGEVEQAHLMEEDAEALYRRDAASFAAVEARGKVVQLAQTTAQRYGAADPEWVKAFANQARMFAERFPQEQNQNRAAVNLIAAGRTCEQFGQMEEARTCFLMVEEKYPDTPFAQQLAGVLRRLRLVGQPLELGGPTIDGGFLSIDQFQGRHVLVVFWASNSEAFQKDLPQLKRISDGQSGGQYTVLGVNLDQDEGLVDRFLEQSGIGWRQIFYSEADKRGMLSPVARHYGIQSVPIYWLVDDQGRVVQAPANLDEVERTLSGLGGGQ